MKLSKAFKEFEVGKRRAKLRRVEGGIVEIEGDGALGLGIAHAHDRMVQMLISRVVAQGRICECLTDSDEAFSFDLLMRKMGFYEDALEDQHHLNPEAKQICHTYADGFNHYLKEFWPLGLGKLIPFKPRPWEVKDTLAVLKLHTYLGLAQIQESAERCIIQAIQEGVDLKKLKALFFPHLEGLTKEMGKLIQQTHLNAPFLPENQRFFGQIAPAFLSSNNWALAPSKTQTKGPFICMDPHLQINRLPPVWYEVVLNEKNVPCMGITAPGIPGVLMGRTPYFSAGFTYGQMDQIDFFIEEIKNGHTLREGQWIALQKREETIHRKKHKSETLSFYESDVGIVETKRDGLCFSMGWANHKRGAASSLNALAKLWETKEVEAALPLLRQVTLSSNWVVADSQGNIAFQQVGRLPKRAHSGLYPLAAWEMKNHWEGFVNPEQLASSINPKQGFVASANDDKNQLGKPLTMNLPIASYRYDRIEQILNSKRRFSLEEQKKLQCDLYSLQAKTFMDKIAPFIPHSKMGAVLKDWNCTYSEDSLGAALFEAFYKELIALVVGEPLFGKKAWEHMAQKPFFAFHYGLFDKVLLEGKLSLWFGGQSRESVFKKILIKTLEACEKKGVAVYGQGRQFFFANILMDEKLPKILGFDYGPAFLEGSRATLAQGQMFYEKGRKIATGASWRFAADLSTQEAHTTLAGGPSENRLSKHYTTDLKNWLSHQYKKISTIN